MGLLSQPTGSPYLVTPTDWVTHLGDFILQGITPKSMASVSICTITMVSRYSLFVSRPDHPPKSFPIKTTLQTDNSKLNSFAPKSSFMPVFII